MGLVPYFQALYDATLPKRGGKLRAAAIDGSLRPPPVPMPGRSSPPRLAPILAVVGNISDSTVKCNYTVCRDLQFHLER